ncbi:MAG: helix-turn-helix transcriptional regulator [Bacteroidota bacterium]
MPTEKHTRTWVENAAEKEKNNFWVQKSQRLALKILMHLKKSKITQSELAEKLEVTPQQVNRILRGKSNLTLETICKIERELKTEFVIIPEPVSWDQIEQLNNYSSAASVTFYTRFASCVIDVEDQINYMDSFATGGKIISMHPTTAREHATIGARPNIGSDKFRTKKVV